MGSRDVSGSIGIYHILAYCVYILGLFDIVIASREKQRHMIAWPSTYMTPKGVGVIL